MSVKTKDIECSFVEPGSHKVYITPLWNGADPIPGKVTAETTTGKYELPVSDFSAEESDAIKRALRASDHVFLKIADDDQSYRIISFIENATTKVIEKFTLYPPLQKTAALDKVVNVAGDDIKIDIGIIGEDAINMSGEVNVIEYKDETGSTVKKVTNLLGVKAEVPALTMTRENFLLIMPKTFFRVKDGDLKFAYGIKKGFQTSPRVAVTIVDREEETNLDKRIFFKSAIMSSEEFELALGGEPTKAFKITFESNGDDLILIGDETAVNAVGT